MAIIENFIFPDFIDLQMVERDRLLTLNADSVMGRLMPLGSQVGRSVIWDKMDNVDGIIPMKGFGNPLPILQMPGGARYSVPASSFGGQLNVQPDEVTSAGRFGSVSEKLNLGDAINEKMMVLQMRAQQTRDYQVSRLINEGKILGFDKDGVINNTYTWGKYNERVEVLSGGDLFTETATCDPIKVFRGIERDYFRGTGFSYRSGFIMMSPVMANIILQADSVKKTIKGNLGASVLTIDALANAYRGDLPPMLVVEGGAHLPDGSFAPYIDDHKIIFVGSHATRGTAIGQWVMTTNEQAGVGENLYANVDLRKEFPRNPFCELAYQGAPRLDSEKQFLVLEASTPEDVEAFFVA
jgi:hypothetical protein